MKKAYLIAVLSLTTICGLGVSAKAQDADSVVVKVPFEFVAGGATLPAGEYRVSRVNPGVNRELAISGYNNNGSAFLLPVVFAYGPATEPTLNFEHVGDKYFLSKIKTLNGVYTMPAQRETMMLGQVNTSSPMSSSGTH